MKIEIEKSRPARLSEWWEIWNGCDYATFYHSPVWLLAYEELTGRKVRNAARYIRFSDDKVALIPVARCQRGAGLLRIHHATPGGNYGGWISRDYLTQRHIELLIHHMKQRFANLIWRLNPLDEQLNHEDLSHAHEDTTLMLDLGKGFDTIFSSWSQGSTPNTRHIQRAHREGVKIREANEEADWHMYYGMFLKRRQQSLKGASMELPPFNWTFFVHLMQHSGKHARLWMAEHNGLSVAGAITLYGPRHVALWSCCIAKGHYHIRPASLLLYHIIKDACDKQYRWFDFLPSGGNRELENFKLNFLPDRYPSRVVDLRSRTVRMLQRYIG